MKVVVIGGGVIGVTSAWYLMKAGYEVSVVDRQPGPALETSFANAGQISPGYASPWAAPGVPLKALGWLLKKNSPFILRPRPNMAMLRWLVSLTRNCTADRYALNKRRMVRLAEYSRDRLVSLRREVGIEYDERSLGTIQLFRENYQLDSIDKDVAILQQDGVPFEVLDRAACIAQEPGLANALTPIAGGLRLPDDETGDCYRFTSRLAEMARQRGVTFLYRSNVRRLVSDGDRISHIETDRGSVHADAILLAAGSYSPLLARPLRIDLPVYPVKGYSITAAITDASHAPRSTLLDESYKVAITRLGDRVRVGGMAEISGYDDKLVPRRRTTLEYSVGTLFPDACDLKGASFWSGLRPTTPDGTPIVGATHIPNLFVNTGHGTLGWTMACGSARVIADIMAGRPPDIAAADLAVSRYR